MNVLILGSGGREHCFAELISESKNCDKLFVAPGNSGTGLIAENLDISPLDFDSVKVSLADQRIEKFHPMLSRIEKSSVEKIMQKSNKIETKMSKKVEVEKSKTCTNII